MFYLALTVEVVEQLYHEITPDALTDTQVMFNQEMEEGKLNTSSPLPNNHLYITHE